MSLGFMDMLRGRGVKIMPKGSDAYPGGTIRRVYIPGTDSLSMAAVKAQIKQLFYKCSLIDIVSLYRIELLAVPSDNDTGYWIIAVDKAKYYAEVRGMSMDNTATEEPTVSSVVKSDPRTWAYRAAYSRRFDADSVGQAKQSAEEAIITAAEREGFNAEDIALTYELNPDFRDEVTITGTVKPAAYARYDETRREELLRRTTNAGEAYWENEQYAVSIPDLRSLSLGEIYAQVFGEDVEQAIEAEMQAEDGIQAGDPIYYGNDGIARKAYKGGPPSAGIAAESSKPKSNLVGFENYLLKEGAGVKSISSYMPLVPWTYPDWEAEASEEAEELGLNAPAPQRTAESPSDPFAPAPRRIILTD